MNSENNLHKTVFISYRREPSRYLALAMFKELQRRGYDVFWDVESIGAGQFEPIILNEIGRRAHFVVLLANQTLDRCTEPNDWLKRELEYAMSLGRKIIPLMVDGFDWKDKEKYLVGDLNKLNTYNGMPLLYQYFDAGIDKLCNQFLSNKNYGTIIEGEADQRALDQIVESVMEEPIPSEAELEAERLLNQGFAKLKNNDFDGALEACDYAIQLNPFYAMAYNNRGTVKIRKQDYMGAIADVSFAISLEPDVSFFYSNRAAAKMLINNTSEALDDLEKAIQLDPNHENAYSNRANLYASIKKFDEALLDQNQAILLNPNDSNLYALRGSIYYELDYIEAALADLNLALELEPNNVKALNSRGVIFQNQGKYKEALLDYDKGLKYTNDEDKSIVSILHNNRGEAHFLLKNYSHAIKDFEKSIKSKPNYKAAAPGMIIAFHAQGQVKKARRMWNNLLKLEPRYADMNWLQKELNWADALVEEARKLSAELPPPH